jgi:hypothetical protein
MLNSNTMDSRIGRLIFLTLSIFISTPLWSCTIFCARDRNGQMWVANNEDFYFFDFSTWIKIKPKTDSNLSYIYFGYGQTLFPQGGVNEAGLFYDANAVELSVVKDADSKIPFPEDGEHAMLLYVLGHCKTVPEAFRLFRKYQTPWLANAQLHLADKEGNMGIVTADSAWLTPGSFQISTNYNLSHNNDDYKKCWRYPIAYSMLNGSDPSFELMTMICDSTSQRRGASTIYSNVHNLYTGEMWLYYAWDYKNPYRTTFGEMVALGDTVIMFRDLFVHQTAAVAYRAYKQKGFAAGLQMINTIEDPELRKEKLKLLSLGALFDFDSFIETGQVTITTDEQLIREIILASEDEEILSRIESYNISDANKKFVSAKLRTSKGSVISSVLIPGVILAAGVLILFWFVRKKVWKRL